MRKHCRYRRDAWGLTLRLHETCTCGAEIEIEDDDADTIRADVAAWRETHRCVGPQAWRRSTHSISDVRLDFGFMPDHTRPAEAM